LGAHRDLHSFPTRRSSDLPALGKRGRRGAAEVVGPSRAGPASRGRPQRWVPGADPGAGMRPLKLLHVASEVVGFAKTGGLADVRSEEHTSELQSLTNLVCR